MKTTKRFEDAVTKLYTAFHNGELDAMDCKHCAVGNMCDNSSEWANGVGNMTSFGESHRILNSFINKTGYSNQELIKIEHIFLYGGEKHLFRNTISNGDVRHGNKTKQEQLDLQFKGLCAVIEYLCELDNIPNVLDFKGLFETEDNKPVNQLQFV
jgi:hypothetical protein